MGNLRWTPSTHLPGRVRAALLRLASFLVAPGRYSRRTFVSSSRCRSIFKPGKLPSFSNLSHYLRLDQAVWGRHQTLPRVSRALQSRIRLPSAPLPINSFRDTSSATTWGITD